MVIDTLSMVWYSKGYTSYVFVTAIFRHSARSLALGSCFSLAFFEGSERFQSIFEKVTPIDQGVEYLFHQAGRMFTRAMHESLRQKVIVASDLWKD